MSQDKDSFRPGLIMIYLALISFLLMLTYFFSFIDQPNQNVEGSIHNGFNKVVLKRGPYGHYIASGTVNGHKVVYLLDTGATTTSFPASVAKSIGLKKGPSLFVSTANGKATAYRTQLNTLTLGPIKFSNIGALISPGYDSNEVLLGMNVLKTLTLIQQGNTLTLIQKTKQ